MLVETILPIVIRICILTCDAHVLKDSDPPSCMRHIRFRTIKRPRTSSSEVDYRFLGDEHDLRFLEQNRSQVHFLRGKDKNEHRHWSAKKLK